MRRAIFGGTFDPIHKAHLLIAREAANAFSLDQVLLIPACQPPFKTTQTPYEHRFRMVQLACEGDSRLVPSRLEEGQTKSYSILTVERLKAEGGELFFIVGADAFAEIETWYRAQDLIRAVEFIVVGRPGYRYAVPAGARVHRLDALELPVSSSRIRQRLANGERIDDLPKPVSDYIREHALYR